MTKKRTSRTGDAKVPFVPEPTKAPTHPEPPEPAPAMLLGRMEKLFANLAELLDHATRVRETWFGDTVGEDDIRTETPIGVVPHCESKIDQCEDLIQQCHSKLARFL